jgi:hypothetical protein
MPAFEPAAAGAGACAPVVGAGAVWAKAWAETRQRAALRARIFFMEISYYSINEKRYGAELATGL